MGGFPGWIRCPYCHGEFSVGGSTAECRGCGERFGQSDSGQWDFRLPGPKQVDLSLSVGDPATFGDVPVGAPETGASTPSTGDRHLDPTLLGQLPRRDSPGSLLDLGCGDGKLAPIVRDMGYEWVGLDVGGRGATVLADAHALPVADDEFDAATSLKVFEHVEAPRVVASEVARVLKPGGVFVGSVAFAEPFHGESQYHHSPNGVVSTLRGGGLDVRRIWAGRRALTVQLAGLFPYLPDAVAAAAVTPVLALHRFWYRVGRRVVDHPRTSEAYRRVRTAGEFYFVCLVPAG